jgi:hypothetical protein
MPLSRRLWNPRSRAFTAEDLPRNTELDQGVPMEEVLADLEAIHPHTEEAKSAQ